MNAQTKVEATTLSMALVSAFAEIEGAAKDKVNPAFKSRYADLASVIDVIRPVLAKHALAFTQHPEPSDKGVCIETVLHHAGGEHLSLGKLFVPANKNDAQGFGSALTYARRYALVTAFGVPVEDDDGNAASKAPQKPEREPEKIGNAEWSLLVQLIETTGTNTQKLCEAYRVESLRDLTVTQYVQATKVLEKRLAEQNKQKETENA